MAARAGQEPKAVTPIPPSSGVVASELSDDDMREAVYRSRKKAVVDILAEKAQVQEVLKAIGKRLTEARQAFKRDTHIELVELDRIIALSQLQRGDRTKSLQDFNWMAEMEGLAPGGQLSMFEAMKAAENKAPTLVKDALDWEMEGRNTYSRGLECKPPADCPSINITDFTRGWHAMQERTAWAMAESGKVVDRNPANDALARLGTQLPPEPGDEEEGGEAKAEDCADCGGDGSLLAADQNKCGTCAAEYEPLVDGERAPESVH